MVTDDSGKPRKLLRALPRLATENYQGKAIVHWTHTVHRRKQGWLDAVFHHRFRELLLHALAREQLACATYVVMPDHIHLLVTGLSSVSDQLAFTRYFRHRIFQGRDDFQLQRQAHDHVLRQSEQESDAFQSIAHYIRENPVRAGLVEQAQAYPFSGCMVPGYFDLDTKDPEFWPRFWRVYNHEIETRSALDG